MTGRPTATTCALALLAGVLVAGTTACSTSAAPAPASTVTVTVTAGTAPPATGTGTPIPTGTSPTPSGPRTTAPLPTSLAVGHQRGAPHSYAEAKARFAKAPVDGSIHGTFRSPSGNIRCDVSNSAAVAACELDQGRIKVPDRLCEGGDAKRVRGVKLTDLGAFPVCTGELGAAGDAPRLGYGSRTLVPGSPFTCLSEAAGVTCIDTDWERGFFIARNTFVTF
jgi:hypothetical protein